MSIFWQSIRSSRSSIVAFGLAGALFALLFTGVYNLLEDQLAEITGDLPEVFEAFIGELDAATTPEGWLGLQLLGLIMPILLSIVGLILGAKAIGAEEDSGVLELLLASPVSRTMIYLQKALGLSAKIGLICLATWIGIAIGSILFDFSVNLGRAAAGVISLFLMGTFFAFVAFAVQAASGRTGLAQGIAGLVLAGMCVANILASLIDQLDYLRHYSAFHYYNVDGVLAGDGLTYNFSVMATITALLFLIGLFAFPRRDTGR